MSGRLGESVGVFLIRRLSTVISRSSNFSARTSFVLRLRNEAASISIEGPFCRSLGLSFLRSEVARLDRGACDLPSKLPPFVKFGALAGHASTELTASPGMH